MLCEYGKQIMPKGENVYYFLCQLDSNKNNNCRFSKWCNLENRFEMRTDSSGKTCKFFALKKEEDSSQKVDFETVKEEENSYFIQAESKQDKQESIIKEELQTLYRKNKKQ